MLSNGSVGPHLHHLSCEPLPTSVNSKPVSFINITHFQDQLLPYLACCDSSIKGKSPEEADELVTVQRSTTETASGMEYNLLGKIERVA